MLKSNGDLVRCVNSKTNQVIKIQRWICDATFGSDKQRTDARLWQSATGFKPQEVEPIEDFTPSIENQQQYEQAGEGDMVLTNEPAIIEQPVKKNIPQKRKKK
jgi:hypothetical protein